MIRTKIWNLGMALMMLFLFQTGFAQYKEEVTRIDAYVQKALTDYNLPGLSIGIVKDGKVIMSKGYGERQVGTPGEVTENSIFAIASLSKAFTTAAIGMLVDEGKMDWDDKVIDHLPYFQLHDPYVTSQMTVKDLLSHRAGLATFDGDLLWYGTNYSRREIVERIRHLPLKQHFRTDFGYQNIMYIAAGQLIEAVSGKSWDDFIAQRIFRPLDMRSSTTSIKAFGKGHELAYPHLKKKPMEHLNYDNSGATAAINSSVNDLNKWIQFWLNNGIVNDDTLLSASSIKMVHRLHTPLNTSSFDAQHGIHFKGYGLGWFLMDYQGKKVIHHGGGLPGYISKIALVPEEGLGMIILTNDMSSLPSAMMNEIVDVFTGADEQDWAGTYLKFSKAYDERQEAARAKKDAGKKAGTQPTRALKDYAGVYTDKMYGSSTVSMEDGQLKLVMDASRPLFISKMEHWQYDTFKIQFNDPFLPWGLVTFEFNSIGEISGFNIDLPNPDFHFFNLHFER